MEAWFLREWQRSSPWQILLRPLSWLFAVLSSLRRALFQVGLFRMHRVGVPVVVIGNITVGGTGKTPVVLAVAQLLARAGFRCGIVTRGYSVGKAGTDVPAVVHVVRPDLGGEITSDEATLLAIRAAVPVYAAVKRVDAARALLMQNPEIDVIVCDDGLQHYALYRDIEICVIDGARGFGNGGMLPAGPLREPESRLRNIDAVVVNRTVGHVGGSRLDTAYLPVPAFSMELGNESFVALVGHEILTVEQAQQRFAGKRVQALAGIGNPQRFFSHLSRLGLVVDACRVFPDHHKFSVQDMPEIGTDIVLMTEKDAVKCTGFADDRMWFMRVDAELPAAFGEFIVNRLSEVSLQHVARSKTA